MIDPWAPPTSAQLTQLRAAPVSSSSVPWDQWRRMSLRSVPDARAPVPLWWWVPAVAALMLGTTTAAILPGSGSEQLVLIAVALSIAGYLLVRWRVRPGRLRTGPYAWPNVETIAQDRTDPPTVFLPIVQVRRRPRGRQWLLLLNSAAIVLGSSVAWSVLSTAVLHPAAPAIHRAQRAVSAFVVAFTDAVITSILEECGIAVLILAVAGLAQRFLPARFDARSVAVLSILVATAVRTALHIPLWGVGAVARLGLSFGLAWLFWRIRRIWPLIIAHVVWDTLALQSAITPSVGVRNWCALAVLAWGIAGVVVAVIAISRSAADSGRAARYFGRPTMPPTAPM